MRRRRKKKINKLAPLLQLKNSDIAPIRCSLLKEQDYICPICKRSVEESEVSLDHQHKDKKADSNGIDGAGCVRGCICRLCNSYEGKIWNNYRRLGLHTRLGGSVKARVKWLKGLIAYYESGYPSIDGNYLIHPLEKGAEPMMGKQLFNKLNKLYKLKYPNRKELKVPLSIGKKGKNKGKWKISTRWEALLKEFKLEY